MLCTGAYGIPRTVNGNIAAADDHDISPKVIGFPRVDLSQKIHRADHARAVFAFHADRSAALTADRDIECLVPFFAKFPDRDILPHFHAASEFHSELTDDIDLRIDHILLQLVGRNAVDQHAAGLLIAVKYSGTVSFLREIVGAGQSCGACSDDCDLLLKPALHSGNDLRRNIPGLRVQILHGDKLLHLVDRDCPVDASSGAGLFTAAVADMPAHRGKRIVLLNERQRVCIPALCRELQVALHRNMGRTGALAGSGSGFMGLDPVVVPVIPVPVILAPGFVRGKQRLGILDSLPVFPAQLLSQAESAGRTYFHTSSAGNTFILIDMCCIRAARHIRGIEKLRGSQRITDVDVAVADGKDLVLSVYIRDLVNKAVLLSLAQDLKRFLPRDVAPALACLHDIVCHIPDGNTPVMKIISAALLIGHPAAPAGTGGGGILPVILIQPV